MSKALTTIDSIQLDSVIGGLAPILPILTGAAAAGTALINSRAFTCGVGATGGYLDGNSAGTSMREWANCMQDPSFKFPPTGTQPAAPTAPAAGEQPN
jgi:hypothetical protein